MKVKEIMSRDVQVVRPDDPLRDVAQKMADYDIGSLPRQFGQVAWRILRHAWPSRAPARLAEGAAG